MRIRKHLPQTVFLLLQGPYAISNADEAFTWRANGKDEDLSLLDSSASLLEEVIRQELMKSCRFEPQHIVLIGYGLGGEVALASAALWEKIELGGVVSIGGSVPYCTRPPQDHKAKTPALILGSTVGQLTSGDLHQTRDYFSQVDPENQLGAGKIDPQEPHHLAPLFDFLIHRLQHEEWTREAVISFGKC